jgi:hypothetical protein
VILVMLVSGGRGRDLLWICFETLNCSPEEGCGGIVNLFERGVIVSHEALCL